jgi:hypothetical protein
MPTKAELEEEIRRLKLRISSVEEELRRVKLDNSSLEAQNKWLIEELRQEIEAGRMFSGGARIQGAIAEEQTLLAEEQTLLAETQTKKVTAGGKASGAIRKAQAAADRDLFYRSLDEAYTKSIRKFFTLPGFKHHARAELIESAKGIFDENADFGHAAKLSPNLVKTVYLKWKRDNIK